MEEPNPVEEMTTKERLGEAISEADATHRKLVDFIGRMFDDSLRQAESIACCQARILSLIDRFPDEQDEVFDIGGRLSVLMQSQSLVSFFGKYNGLEIILPPADAYGGKQKYLDWTYEVSFAQCDEHYKAPIPNSSEARKIERRSFAEEIVRAKRRLAFYAAKLPVIEASASRALAFEATLRKMRKDLDFDLLDPMTAAGKMREYEEFLNGAVDTLNNARREVADDSLVKDHEIDEVLRIATQ
ncbi:MAG: hypothetical protein GY719_14505 [bacterium]|nr:hypothetical protein [bacterium]